MKKINLYKAWAALYTLCVGFGFVSKPDAFGKVLLVALSLLCFVPPFYLAIRARKEENRKTLKVLRLVSILSLSLTLLLTLAAVPAAHADNWATAVVKGGWLRLREEPSSDAVTVSSHWIFPESMASITSSMVITFVTEAGANFSWALLS